MTVKADNWDALTFDPSNPNRGTDKGRALVKSSLEQVGAGRSIVADKNGVIVAGNKTMEQAQALGLKPKIVDVKPGELLVARRNDWDASDADPENPAKKYRYLDNRSGQLGLDWDPDVLTADLELGVDLDGLGFSTADLEGLGIETGTGGKTPPDEVPEPPAVPVTKPGDLWELGRHRLVCGDSTDADTVAALMAGELGQMGFTDPPFGVDYTGGTAERERLAGDRTPALYEPALQMMSLVTDDQAPCYLWFSDSKTSPVAAAVMASGYDIRAQIIWNKNQAQFGALSAQYKQKHELVLYLFKAGKPPRWHGPTNEVTVWDCDRASSNEFHPTQKPVALSVRAIGNSSERGDIVLDLFLGSGATLIGAQQQNRRCYGVELSPAYCDVIIERWENFTGGKAKRL